MILQSAPVAPSANEGARDSVATCLYCGRSEHERVAENVEDWFFQNVAGGFDFERCSNCASLWMSARLKPENLLQAYATYYTHEPEEAFQAQREVKSWLRRCYIRDRFHGRANPVSKVASFAYQRMARDLASVDMAFRFAPRAPARILDYGCGGGAFLRQMQALGHDVTGVDFDPVILEPLRADGITAFSVDELSSQNLEESFDCITLNHVIEHVTDPLDLLRNLFQMLKSGGILYCESPNAESAGLDVFGGFWRGLEAPRHLSVPSRRGLGIALSKAGFRDECWIEHKWVRPWTWPASLSVVPEHERPAVETRMAAAPAQNLANAEYLIVTAKKPA